ncbi:hypothetical protein [Mycoplasmopsis fermentans]|uniref:hypothetical protein n=1 Tax=Mycoplasmopsis fermentans TaxID=2115 RepID=UPI0003074276|nr:hypothetical protein [Mycoplasmopsis fermentans]
MSNLREKLKKCSNESLKCLWDLVGDISDLPLSDDIKKVVECLEQPDYCEHYKTHEQFLRESYKEIKNKIKEYNTLIETAIESLASNFSLFYLTKSIKLKLKTVEIYVKNYKYNEWDIEDVNVEIAATKFDDYLNNLNNAIYDELETRKKEND